MKNLLFIVFLLFSGLNIGLCQSWHQVGEIPSGGRFDDISFVNPMTGWTVTGNGKIYKTNDGGSTWDTQLSTGGYFRSVEFINDSVGFAGNLNGKLFQTLDGGLHWIEIQNRINEPKTGLCGISHVGNHIYGVGIFSYPAYFIRSDDLGESFTYKQMDLYANGLVDCHFLNENVGFVSGIHQATGGVILKTIDGGDTWKLVHNTHDAIEYVWKLFFVTDSIAYGSVESSDGETTIVKTVDGGDTWVDLVVSEENLDIQGIGFINKDTGWVCPRTTGMYETTDGGQTWEQKNNIRNINRITKTEDGVLYASGSQVYKYDLQTSSRPDVVNFTPFHEIIKVSPNPFHDQLNVDIMIDRNTHSRLDLVSLDGRQIRHIHDGTLHAGLHKFTLQHGDLLGFNPGAYILFLRTDEGFLSKEIIKN